MVAEQKWTELQTVDEKLEWLALLRAACQDHTRGLVTADPTIGVCWDADRLNLWRVKTKPDPALLSTPAARRPEMIARAVDFHLGAPAWPAVWTELLRQLQPGAAEHAGAPAVRAAAWSHPTAP